MNTKSLKKDVEAVIKAKTFAEEDKKLESLFSRKHWNVWKRLLQSNKALMEHPSRR